MYVVNNAINMSNLVQYVDLVNDDDAFLALKWTYKEYPDWEKTVLVLPERIDM